MPLASYTYHSTLTDSNSTGLSNFVVRINLTAANFDFTKAKADGSDLRVRDETAGALVPLWIADYDSVGQVATLYFKATSTNSTHHLYYGNPAATAVSSFATVFTHGTGFDTNWGDLTTNVAGTHAEATRIAGPTSTSDLQNLRNWRIGENPILSFADLVAAGVPAGNYTGVREFSPVRDGSNKIIAVGGKYYVFFARRPTTVADHIDTWRCESASSPYGPYSNFVQIYTPPAGIRLGYVGSVQKIGSLYYLYLTYGWSDLGGQSPGISLWYMTSTDCLTWSGITQCVLPASYKDSVGNACTDIGNPWVVALANGTYAMTFEGMQNGGPFWSINGATSTDGITWTPINSGTPLIVQSGTATWDRYSAANPKLIQMPDGTFAIMYNGGEDPVTSSQQLGIATASTLAGTWTKASFNPIAGTTFGIFGLESSSLCWDTDGVTPSCVIQQFTGTSATGSFYRLLQEKQRGGILLSRDIAGTGVSDDGAVAGIVVGPNTFTAETRSVFTAHRSASGTPALLGLYNSATLPTPAAGSLFDANGVVEIMRWTRDFALSSTQGPGDISIRYYDSGLAIHWWNGSAWSTSQVGRAIAVDNSREVVARISDDGTNYVLSVAYADDGTTIASASIAQLSCNAWTNRLVWCGDYATNSWQQGLYLRSFVVRPYAAVEPVIAVGPALLDTATSYTFTAALTSGLVGQVSGPFTITPNMAFPGTITITPSGGGLTTPIILTFASAAPQTFTITPLSAGPIPLTPTNSGGLINPAPLIYTANVVQNTWPYMSTTYAFTVDRAPFLGYTVFLPTGVVHSPRSTAGIVSIGNAFVASVPLPYTGAVLIDWDDGINHDVDPVPETFAEGSLTVVQVLAELLAAQTGKTANKGLIFYAPDGTTPRITGTTAAGDRTSSILTPPV